MWRLQRRQGALLAFFWLVLACQQLAQRTASIKLDYCYFEQEDAVFAQIHPRADNCTKKGGVWISQGQANLIRDRQLPEERRERSKGVSSTGTGFYVTRAGHLLTNEHVVDDCRKVTLQAPGKRRHDAWVVVRDKINDLALLKTDAKTDHVAVLRSGKSVRPGNEIVSFGFPLSGYLSSRGNLTVGRISALAGLGDDARLFQITAPVQKGNSGGPILDLSGNVVGVVVSKLAAIKFAKVTGTIPQNVNFAIKRRIIEDFLNANDVKYATSRPVKRLDPSDVGEIAKKFTVKVECWR